MRDVYKGETIPKKLARFDYWWRVKYLLEDERFLDGPHLVLASREGGDVSTLLGLGVPPSGIIACDSNREAAEACREKFPDVPAIHGDVAAVARKHGRSIASAYLDFCGKITTEASLRAIMQVMVHGLKMRGALIGWNFMRARENAGAKHIFTREYDRLKDFIRGATGRDYDYRCELDESMDHARFGWVTTQLCHLGYPLRCVPVPTWQCEYQSSNENGMGQPMMMGLAWKIHEPGKQLKKFLRRVLMFTAANQHFIDQPGGMDNIVKYDAVMPDDSLRSAALQLEAKMPGRAHLLLNIPRGQVAAWRAHETRGSYRSEAA